MRIYEYNDAEFILTKRELVAYNIDVLRNMYEDFITAHDSRRDEPTRQMYFYARKRLYVFITNFGKLLKAMDDLHTACKTSQPDADKDELVLEILDRTQRLLDYINTSQELDRLEGPLRPILYMLQRYLRSKRALDWGKSLPSQARSRVWTWRPGGAVGSAGRTYVERDPVGSLYSVRL